MLAHFATGTSTQSARKHLICKQSRRSCIILHATRISSLHVNLRDISRGSAMLHLNRCFAERHKCDFTAHYDTLLEPISSCTSHRIIMLHVAGRNALVTFLADSESDSLERNEQRAGRRSLRHSTTINDSAQFRARRNSFNG